MKYIDTINFGGVNSGDYNLMIKGVGVFSAPKRAVEEVNIPGRNGSLMIDQGYYENIEGKYQAIYVGENLDDLARNIEAFRNAIASMKGYQRLEDSIYKNEYRLAVFKDGLTVKPKGDATTVEFEIIFNCMPQRFLKDGELPITLAASGEKIINPTLHESGPLLAVDGYGTISFNGYDIELEQATVGDTKLFEQSTSEKLTKTFTINNSLYNSGDTITLCGAVVTHELINATGWFAYIYSTSIEDVGATTTLVKKGSQLVHLVTKIPTQTFTAGTAESFVATVYATIEFSNRDQTVENTFEIDVNYTPGETEDTIAISVTNISTSYGSVRYNYLSGTSCNVDSSIEALGDPTYIDCDLGECYMIVDDEIVSLNSWVDLGSDLPVLAPGENTITYDDTVTGLTLTPKWWQL